MIMKELWQVFCTSDWVNSVLANRKEAKLIILVREVISSRKDNPSIKNFIHILQFRQ